MKHVKLFEQFINEDKIQNALNNIDKWMPDDSELQDEYYQLINDKDQDGMEEFLDMYADEDRLMQYGIKFQDLGKLAKAIINESSINEYTGYNFKPAEPSSKDKKGAEKWLKKYMLRTARTTDEATERIQGFAGGVMFTHVQYHVVKPNGNKPDRPTFRLHQSQEWLNDANLRGREEVNATLLSIYQLKDGEEWNSSQGDAYEKVGQIYVDTKAFLNELSVVFETIKKSM